MAYETEKVRMINEITATVGIARQRDGALEREATERAFEVRQQTGLTYDGPQDIPIHPSSAERQARLGVPSTVGTVELATWNYLYEDPVGAAIEGLLTSSAHRAVLDNPYYKYWGFGIYTEMPEGETAEIMRRWWFVIWLSNVSIASAVEATPSERLDPVKPVRITPGRHYAYRFGYDGRILETKTTYQGLATHANADGRGRIPNREGVWLHMADGKFAGFWIKEHGFLTKANRVALT